MESHGSSANWKERGHGENTNCASFWNYQMCQKWKSQL